MRTFAFYRALQDYFLKGEFNSTVGSRDRVTMKLASSNFVLKNSRLFYTGPRRRYMRLVVLSEAEKRCVLMECHSNTRTGNHNGIRSTRDRVIAGYYWPTLIKDVTDWVKSCHRCHLNYPGKTVASILHPVKVNEAWEVLLLDLIGPLPETARHNMYVLTMTDLYTKWVIAEPLRSKTASEVSLAITSKLYLFGMVKKIVTVQGKEFVNELNDCISELMNIKHAVSSVCHPQTNGQDEWTNQNIKHALKKCVNDSHNEWDLHLCSVVYSINTAKQSSTRYSPYFLLFHRHPRLPEVMNASSIGSYLDIADPEDDIDTKVNEVKILNEKVLRNIDRIQSCQQKSLGQWKRRFTTVGSVDTGDDVLLSQDAKKQHTEDNLRRQHKRPDIVTGITSEDVPTERTFLQDHCYSQFHWQVDHPYALSGPHLEKHLSPLQDEPI